MIIKQPITTDTVIVQIKVNLQKGTQVISIRISLAIKNTYIPALFLWPVKYSTRAIKVPQITALTQLFIAIQAKYALIDIQKKDIKKKNPIYNKSLLALKWVH